MSTCKALRIVWTSGLFLNGFKKSKDKDSEIRFKINKNPAIHCLKDIHLKTQLHKSVIEKEIKRYV